MSTYFVLGKSLRSLPYVNLPWLNQRHFVKKIKEIVCLLLILFDITLCCYLVFVHMCKLDYLINYASGQEYYFSICLNILPTK